MTLLSVAKAALYGIFLNYYCYYTVKGSFLPGGTVLFLGIALLFGGMDALRQRYVRLGTEIRCWLLYAALALVTTTIITVDTGSTSFVSDIVKFVQRVAIIMMIAYICEREGSIRFGLRLMAVTAVACAISVISVIGDYQLKLNITSGANLSENDVGSIMAFGCFALMFAWGRRKHTSLVLSGLKAAGFICCVVVIFLSGSRKSVLAVLLMLAVLLLLCLLDYGRYLNLYKFLTTVIIGTVIYLYISENLLPYAEQTSLYTRMFGRGNETAADSDDGRIKLIRFALEHFAEHPLMGLGFNQYRKYHGVYSHCTYVEPLACSGLIGLLYLYPYYSIVKKQLYLIRISKRGSYARLKQKELFAYLCMFLFIGVGIPFMYKDVPCIILGTFVASQAISFRELHTSGNMSADY